MQSRNLDFIPYFEFLNICFFSVNDFFLQNKEQVNTFTFTNHSVKAQGPFLSFNVSVTESAKVKSWSA